MPNPARILRATASWLSAYGLHTGDQFAANGPVHDQLDICAVIYQAAEHDIPAEFYTDEAASLRLIECSAPAMQAIRALSDALDTDPPVTQITDDHSVPDYIEHVCHWATTTPVFGTRPPTIAEVIGRLIRTADQLDAATRPRTAA